jgi:hypothetical protein
MQRRDGLPKTILIDGFKTQRRTRQDSRAPSRDRRRFDPHFGRLFKQCTNDAKYTVHDQDFEPKNTDWPLPRRIFARKPIVKDSCEAFHLDEGDKRHKAGRP